MENKVVLFGIAMLMTNLTIFDDAQASEQATVVDNKTMLHTKSSPYSSELARINGITPRESIATGPITAFPKVETVDPSTGNATGKIPAEYANILRLTNQSQYKIVGARMTTANYARFYTVNTEAFDGQPHYVEISHVATYKGKTVDVRINVEDMLGTWGTRELDIFTPTDVNSIDFLHLEMRGVNNNIFLRYEFLDHDTGKVIPFKGTWIIKRLNSYKNIQLDTRPEFLKSIFAYSNSAIRFKSTTEFDTTMFSSTSASTVTNNVVNQLMFSFDAIDGNLRQMYLPNGDGTRYVYYESTAIAPIEIPQPSIIGQTNEEYPRVSYQISQDYPAQAKKESYLKRYKITIQLDKILKMNKVKYKVTKADGTDVTNLFTMTKDDSRSLVYFEINPTTLSDPNFADNVYKIELESDINPSVSKDGYVKEDGYFHIPATMKMESDSTNTGLLTSVAKTKYVKGYVDVQYLLDDEKTKIKPSKKIEGEIGEPYSVASLDIPEYKHIKTIGNTKGVFDKGPKLVQFIYQFAPNVAPKITFDQQATEEIPYEGLDFKLSGQVSDEDSEIMKVYYILDDGEPVEVASYTQIKGENKPIPYETAIAKEKLQDGKKHKITVYAVDGEGEKSEEKSVNLQAFEGQLQIISAPTTISFGKNLPITSKKETYYVESKEKDLIVQDTRPQKGIWKMGVTLAGDLTSSSGDTIHEAFHYDHKLLVVGQQVNIFEQDTLDSQPVNISKDWIDKKQGLNITVPTGDVKAEKYTAKLTWTLDDTP